MGKVWANVRQDDWLRVGPGKYTTRRWVEEGLRKYTTRRLVKGGSGQNTTGRWIGEGVGKHTTGRLESNSISCYGYIARWAPTTCSKNRNVSKLCASGEEMSQQHNQTLRNIAFGHNVETKAPNGPVNTIFHVSGNCEYLSKRKTQLTQNLQTVSFWTWRFLVRFTVRCVLKRFGLG